MVEIVDSENHRRQGHPGPVFDCAAEACHPLGIVYDNRFWPVVDSGIGANRVLDRPSEYPEQVATIRYKIAPFRFRSLPRRDILRITGLTLK